MRIHNLKLTNFNCFSEREIDLTDRFNLIVGDNATGKTTLLDALAVGLGTLFLGFPPPAIARSIHRDEARLARFRLGDAITVEPQFPVVVECKGIVNGENGDWGRELLTETGRTTRQNATWISQLSAKLRDEVKDGKEVVLPVISFYGTGRLWVQKRQRKVKTLKPDSRFVGYLDCLDPASDEKRMIRWFKTQEITALQRKEKIGTLEACRTAVLSCVPEATKVEFDIGRDELMIEFPQGSLPFSYLSDGFRNMVAMVADIAVRCASLNPQLKGEAARTTPGVVMIDEIDLHLHPKWQRRVVNDLLNAFPKVQFIATSHSPFVIQSLPALEGVQLLNLDNPNAENFVNKSVEDITEEVQGVDLPQRSKRFVDMMAAAEKYYSLLKESGRRSKHELLELSKRLDELSMPFSDDPAYHALLQSQRNAASLQVEEDL
jgi:predicted ATP-binding protein involved in virulence